MEPLSDVLSLLKPVSHLSGGLDAGAEWSIRFPAPEGIRFQIVMEGACWLMVDGVDEPIRLQAGDGLLLPRRRAFVLSTNPLLHPVEAAAAFAGSPGPIVSFNGAGEFLSLWNVFKVTGKPAEILLESLPPFIQVRRNSEHASMQQSIDRLMKELRERQPGFALVAQNCSYMLLVDLLREHLAQASSERVGWLFALVDPQVSKAISAMHTQPARHWTLDELAKDSGMSRSAFAVRFKARVSTPPMEYLTRWRMLLAGDKLAATDEPLARIASSLGYESEASFSHAFKRVMGCSPRRYAREQARDRWTGDRESRSGPRVAEAMAPEHA